MRLRVPPARSKYGVRLDAAGKAARTCNGHLFASQAECRRYAELLLLEKAGQIDTLERQPAYVLSVRRGHEDVALGVYRADFRYMESGTSRQIVEDVKGMATTPLSKWKQKHVAAQYGITVREIRR